MTINTHAMLAPSSSNRWLNCTPSARLEELEEQTRSIEPSVYAEEGTEAHTLAEIKLSFMLGKISAQLYDTKFEHFKLSSKYYNAEFNDYVNDYCTEVMTIITENYKGLELEVYLEENFILEPIVPEGSGTGDVAIVGTNFIHIIDFKFGRGIPVSAINNSQLRLYAVGAILKYGKLKLITEVRTTIIQPRLYDTTTECMLAADLNSWAIDYVKPRAELAYNGLGELTPGDHCMFCKYRGKCEALGNAQLAIAQREFEDVVVKNAIFEPKDMTPEMFKNILDIAPKFIAWFNAVTSYATASMINGSLKVPGYKVVEGRSNRIITSPEAIQNILKDKGFEESDYMSSPVLLGISSLETKVGKKLFNELCSEYILKPIGKPTIAVETDKRPALEDSRYKLVGQEFDEE